MQTTMWKPGPNKNTHTHTHTHTYIYIYIYKSKKQSNQREKLGGNTNSIVKTKKQHVKMEWTLSTHGR